MSQKTTRPLPASAINHAIQSLISGKKVRRVVTPSGHRARGHFPSLKGLETSFESLVEEDSLRVLEVSTIVGTVQSHPFVLRLVDPHDERPFHYTPDVALLLSGSVPPADPNVLLEVKGDWLMKLPSSVRNLRRLLRAARHHKLSILLFTETDVRASGLQEELKRLLRLRPTCNRRRQNIDPNEWDPTGNSEPSAETLRRWREAQRTCDELLQRVMRRDPDALIDTFNNQ